MYSNIYCPQSQRGDQPLQSCVFLRGWNALLGNWRANVFEYILSAKSTWRSTPSELRGFFWEQGTPILEIKEDSLRFTLRRNEERMYLKILFSRKSTWRSTPSELHFFERMECFAWKLKSECIRIYIVRKVNVAINPFRAAGIFWEQGTPILEIKEDRVRFTLRRNEERMYLNIHFPESQRGDQPFQSCVFLRGWSALLGNWRANVFEYMLSWKSTWQSTSSELRFLERMERFAWKLKSECIRIYIVQKVNVAINPFRSAFFFFWEQGMPILEIKEESVRFVLRGDEE